MDIVYGLEVLIRESVGRWAPNQKETQENTRTEVQSNVSILYNLVRSDARQLDSWVGKETERNFSLFTQSIRRPPTGQEEE